MKKIKKIQQAWDNHKNKSGLNFRRRRKRFQKEKAKKISILVVELLAVITAGFLVASGFGIRVEMPGESMKDTIKKGDVLLIDRFAYQIGNPKENDVVAFLPKGNLNAQYSIKRIIGVPGDKIKISNGAVYVNGKVFETMIRTSLITNPGLAAKQITLGKNEYFVLGDNRNNSEDSRYETIGNISKGEIAGKVWFDTSLDNLGLVE